MMKLACKDIDPSSTCIFEATGTSAKEVVGKMLAHMKQNHMEDIKGRSDAQLREMLESKVHD